MSLYSVTNTLTRVTMGAPIAQKWRVRHGRHKPRNGEKHAIPTCCIFAQHVFCCYSSCKMILSVKSCSINARFTTLRVQNFGMRAVTRRRMLWPTTCRRRCDLTKHKGSRYGQHFLWFISGNARPPKLVKTKKKVVHILYLVQVGRSYTDL